jgi:hypothetical protein
MTDDITRRLAEIEDWYRYHPSVTWLLATLRETMAERDRLRAAVRLSRPLLHRMGGCSPDCPGCLSEAARVEAEAGG